MPAPSGMPAVANAPPSLPLRLRRSALSKRYVLHVEICSLHTLTAISPDLHMHLRVAPILLVSPWLYLRTHPCGVLEGALVGAFPSRWGDRTRACTDALTITTRLPELAHVLLFSTRVYARASALAPLSG